MSFESPNSSPPGARRRSRRSGRTGSTGPFSFAHTRKLRAPIAAVVIAALGLSVLGLAPGSLPTAQAASPVVASVPTPDANHAVISVKVGGARLPDGSVGGVAGVRLSLYDAGTATTTTGGVVVQGVPGARYNPTWSWTTCISDIDGDCNFVIPVSASTAGTPTQASVPRDTRFWVAQNSADASPAGYYSSPQARVGGFGPTPEYSWNYEFRTGLQLRGGATYLSTTPMTASAEYTSPDLGFMRNREASNVEGSFATNVTRSTGVWSQSLDNPPLPKECGLKVGVVFDTSGSLGETGIANAKAALDTFVDSFKGTSTEMSLFSFSTTSPGTGATNAPALLPVTTTAQADIFKAQYEGWESGGGTNWDRGFAKAANSGNAYDLVILLTDGNPTVYGETPSGAASAYNTLGDIDAGIFSANQLKAAGTRIMAIGVGSAVNTPASAFNLRAVSGQVEGDDFIRADDFSEAGDVLAAIATANCQGSIAVQKMIVPAGGTIAQATPAPAGWEFAATTSATGTTITTPTDGLSTTTDDSNGRVNFGLGFAAPTKSGAVQILETQQPGFEVVPVGTGADARNAQCVNTENDAIVPVTNAGTDGNPGFTVAGSLDVQILCTIYNTQPINGFTLNKTSNPAAGAAVAAGGTITYTLTGTNTGTTVLNPVAITDDLSGVLANATITTGPAASTGAAPSITGTTLNWSGVLQPGQSVAITYTVTLNSTIPAGTVILNTVTGTATPPTGPPIIPPPVTTEHPVAGFTLAKTSEPVSGSTVSPGDTITYTVTGTNTGATDLDPVVITDDLSGVLNNATAVGTPTSSTGAAPVLTGSTLTWNGVLPVGGSVELSYQVVVNADAAPGITLNNRVVGSATPPGVPPIVPPPITTSHPTPGFALTKTANPATGTSVMPGTAITYTITGNNTGATILDPVSITDDLSGALGNATLTTPPSSSVGSAPVLSGNEFTWTGTLAAGESVVITYTVTVDSTVPNGTIIRNHVEGEGTPPGEPPLVPPPVDTEHPVAGFTLEKSASPASGTDVRSGSSITYTVTGTNTGASVLDPVTITDDLSGVLNNTTLDGTPTASYGSAPILTGTTLTWTGSLPAGQAVVLTYTVTVNDTVPEATMIANHVTGQAVPPGLPPIVPPPVGTEHPLSSFTLTKSSNPASGSAVESGGTITYTLTGTNTGATDLDPVVITDDLSQVLNNTVIEGPLTSTVGQTPTITGTTLNWSGNLPVGQSVVISYTVRINANVPPATVLNNTVSGTATPPTGPPIIPPPVTTTNPLAGFTLTKTSDPVTGSTVNGGDTIVYTVTGTNTGATVLDPVTITDDLSGVLGNAALTGDAVATINGNPTAAPTIDRTTLTWTGTLAVGEVVTIGYTVEVAADVEAGVFLINRVTGQATPPGLPPIVPPPVETQQSTPGFILTKTSDPASGSTVPAGGTITYSVVGTNTGEGTLSPVVITDDLSKVLNNATMVGSPTSSFGAAPVLSGTELSWSGELPTGGSVTLSYTVKVNQEVGAQTIITNTVSGTATPPTGPPITPPIVTTDNPVPGFTLVKSSDPKSGTDVKAGQTITYTITGTNTGATVLAPVVITDDLSKVLNNTVLQGTPTSSLGAAPVLSGDTLSWNGNLGVGQSIVITYRVTVKGDVSGVTVQNTVTGSATPPGLPPITPPPSATTHTVPPAGLALTGAILTPTLAAAALLLLLGGVIVVLRRRKHAGSGGVAE